MPVSRGLGGLTPVRRYASDRARAIAQRPANAAKTGATSAILGSPNGSGSSKDDSTPIAMQIWSYERQRKGAQGRHRSRWASRVRVQCTRLNRRAHPRLYRNGQKPPSPHVTALGRRPEAGARFPRPGGVRAGDRRRDPETTLATGDQPNRRRPRSQ